MLVEDDSPIKYSIDTVFFTENYEVVWIATFIFVFILFSIGE